MLSMHCLVMYFCSTLFLLFSFPFIIKLTVIHSFCFCCFCRLPKNVVSMCVRMLMVFFGNIYFFWWNFTQKQSTFTGSSFSITYGKGINLKGQVYIIYKETEPEITANYILNHATISKCYPSEICPRTIIYNLADLLFN